MPKIILRPRTPRDEEFLYKLYSEMRTPEFAALPLSDLQKSHLIQMQYRAQNGSYAAMYPGSDYQVVWVQGEPVGRIWIAKDAMGLTLVDIAVSISRQNSGIGTELVKSLQQEAALVELPIRASVFRFKPGSLRFHQRLGFQIVGEEEVQYRMEWRPERSQ